MKINKENNYKLYDFNINEYNIKWLKSLEEFKKYYKSKRTWKLNWKYSWILDKLDNLSNLIKLKYSQKIDPIEYLIYLYFWKQISINDISLKLKKIWINYPKSTLHNLYYKTLQLKLRDRLEETESKKNKEYINWKNNSFNKKRLEETSDAISKIIESNKWINKWFDLNTYNKLKNKSQKIKYLLNSFSFIKENSDKELYNFIEKLHNWGLWTHRITNLLKEIINKYIIENNKLDIKYFKIDSKLIWEILQQKNS